MGLGPKSVVYFLLLVQLFEHCFLPLQFFGILLLHVQVLVMVVAELFLILFDVVFLEDVLGYLAAELRQVLASLLEVLLLLQVLGLPLIE